MHGHAYTPTPARLCAAWPLSNPSGVALMHGPTFVGDGAAGKLICLAEYFESRLALT